MPHVVEVFADICCPFTHVGLRRFVEARADRGREQDVRLHVKAWPLEVVNGVPLAAAKVGEEIAALRASVAEDLFGGFDPAVFPASSLPAMSLAAAGYARDLATGEAVSLRVRAALFEEGRPVDEALLASLAEDLGLDPTAVGDPRAPLAEYAEGRRREVVGSPHFFVGGSGWFCPALTITHSDLEGFVVVPDRAAWDGFLDAALA